MWKVNMGSPGGGVTGLRWLCTQEHVWHHRFKLGIWRKYDDSTHRRFWAGSGSLSLAAELSASAPLLDPLWPVTAFAYVFRSWLWSRDVPSEELSAGFGGSPSLPVLLPGGWAGSCSGFCFSSSALDDATLGSSCSPVCVSWLLWGTAGVWVDVFLPPRCHVWVCAWTIFGFVFSTVCSRSSSWRSMCWVPAGVSVETNDLSKLSIFWPLASPFPFRLLWFLFLRLNLPWALTLEGLWSWNTHLHVYQGLWAWFNFSIRRVSTWLVWQNLLAITSAVLTCDPEEVCLFPAPSSIFDVSLFFLSKFTSSRHLFQLNLTKEAKMKRDQFNYFCVCSS